MCSHILVHDQLAGFSGSESESQSTMKSSGLCFSDLSSDLRCPGGSDCDCDCRRASRPRCDDASATGVSPHSRPHSSFFSSSRLKDRSTKMVKRLRLWADRSSSEALDRRAASGGDAGAVLGEDGVLDEFLFIVIGGRLSYHQISSSSHDDSCCLGTSSMREARHQFRSIFLVRVLPKRTRAGEISDTTGLGGACRLVRKIP
jgi:hypothetical protein